jgi:hypothetical protein
MTNSSNLTGLARLIQDHNVDCKAVIPVLEDAINMERTNIDAYRSLQDHGKSMDGEYRIAHTQLLLALLRVYIRG